jgi:hypothetical protein
LVPELLSTLSTVAPGKVFPVGMSGYPQDPDTRR